MLLVLFYSSYVLVVVRREPYGAPYGGAKELYKEEMKGQGVGGCA